MTEPERPLPDGTDGQPAPQQPAAPTPPPSPYERPPLPGENPSAPVPAQPYGQPVPLPAPAQPYGYQPASAQTPPPPYGQQPYGAPQQPFYGAGQQPPYAPYPQQPYPPAGQAPKKKWPWVLAGCLLLFLLGIGGCVGCVSCAMYLDDGYNGSFDTRYGSDDGSYRYPDSSDSVTGAYSLSEIRDALSLGKGGVADGKAQPGVYTVGAGKDLDPGRYFFEGSQTAESTYYVFDGEGPDSYLLENAVVYFGNYLGDLEEGDVVAFEAAGNLRMYPVALAQFAPQPPYASGLYRVGTDLPAGTYTVTLQQDAAAAAEHECAAYVMKDLEFDSDSVTETRYVVAGSMQTVTVKDGDYLELFGATAVAAS